MTDNFSKPPSISNIPESKSPQTYFDLIDKVGNAGKYQRNIFLIFCLVYFVTGSILLSTAFLFLNHQINCQKVGYLTNQCQKNICLLTGQQRKIFIGQNQENINSIATQFGPFICQDQIYLDIISSGPYFGSFLGFLTFSYVSDNFGRKRTFVIALSLASIGCLLVSLGLNITTIGIGLVLSGAGINTCANLVFNFLGQTVQNIKRQKYSILVQISYTFGSMIVTALYFLIRDWQIICIVVQLIPIFILLISSVLYIEQTPLFLLKYSNQKALKSLNRIGFINTGIKQILIDDDLQNVRFNQLLTQKQFSKKKVTPLDLIRYKSLRTTTICSCFLSVLIFAMYYGPALIIDSIGFNIFVSSFAIQLSELFGYIPCYYFVEKVSRKKTGFFLFLVAVISSFILSLISKPQNCGFCLQGVIEVIVIFIFRFAVATQFILFLVYIVQLFPSTVIGIGMGANSAFGTMSSTLCPIVLGILQRNQFNIMLLFMILGIVAICLTTLLQETHGKPLKLDIQEIAKKKIIKKTQILKSQLSIKFNSQCNLSSPLKKQSHKQL